MSETRRAFFNRIADQWDGWADLEHMRKALLSGFVELGIPASASVVDLGCGTGNLALALMEHLNEQGRVIAVDFSENMIEQARAKVLDPRVSWVQADASSLPLEPASVDHVVCFCAWPHFPEPLPVVEQIRRVLVPGGVLTIWHAISRAEVNAIHQEVSPAVHSDLLRQASEVASLLESAGFEVGLQVDDASRYVVQAMLSQT